MKEDKKPILIGGDFTPDWHIPNCPCNVCEESREQLDKLCEWLKARRKQREK